MFKTYGHFVVFFPKCVRFTFFLCLLTILFDTIHGYDLSRRNDSYVSITNCREAIGAWGVPAPPWVLMCMIGYNVDNVWHKAFDATGLKLCQSCLHLHHRHLTPPFPFVRVISLAAGGATAWHKHTAHYQDSGAATLGVWKLSLFFFLFFLLLLFFFFAFHVLTLCLSKQSIKRFYAQGLLWTHTVYCEVWAC